MGKPEQITKKSHRGESESPEAESSEKKVKFGRGDLLKTLRKYAKICEHNIKVKEIIKHKTHKKDYCTDAIGELKEHKNNIKDWSPAECLATYIYIVSMYTDKTSYEYNFEKLPAQQSGAFKDFYDEVIEKIPADQQKGPNKDPLYRIFNRVTKLHNSNDFNDYDAYNEIIKDVKNADRKSPEELEAKREQRIEEESQKLKEMFDTISEKIEKMGEFNDEEANKIIKESMKEYKQYGSRGFTIARSYLNKFLDADTSEFDKKIKKYRFKKEHTELEKKVNDYFNKFRSLYKQKENKDLCDKLKTSIEKECFGKIKELSIENVNSAREATNKLINTIDELAEETKTDDQLTKKQKDSFNKDLSVLKNFLKKIILDFVWELDEYLKEGTEIEKVVKLKSGKINFNLKFIKYHDDIDSSNILYLEEAFRPLFECLNAMYQEARSGKTIDVFDKDNERKLRLGKWKLDDWLENGSSSSDTIILYPAKCRPGWIEGTKPHAIKFYKTEEYYIYDIGETLGQWYSSGGGTEKLSIGKEHPFFEAVEKVFKVSRDITAFFNYQEWNVIAYSRSELDDTPFFGLACKWHNKLSKKLQMEEINFNPIPTGDKCIGLFLSIEKHVRIKKRGSKFTHVRTVRYVGHENL